MAILGLHCQIRRSQVPLSAATRARLRVMANPSLVSGLAARDSSDRRMTAQRRHSGVPASQACEARPVDRGVGRSNHRLTTSMRTGLREAVRLCMALYSSYLRELCLVSLEESERLYVMARIEIR